MVIGSALSGGLGGAGDYLVDVGDGKRELDLWDLAVSTGTGTAIGGVGGAAFFGAGKGLSAAWGKFVSTRTAAPLAENVASTAIKGVDLSLKYKLGWSPAQIAEADAKVAALSSAAQDGRAVVSSVERSGTSASMRYTRAGNSVPSGSDVDHVLDLQLGGADILDNMLPLNSSVNRSLGAQIACQIRGVPVGTQIGSVSIC